MSRIVKEVRPEPLERNNIRAGSVVFFFFLSPRTRQKKKISV
jgi:hypothetical protein